MYTNTKAGGNLNEIRTRENFHSEIPIDRITSNTYLTRNIIYNEQFLLFE